MEADPVVGSSTEEGQRRWGKRWRQSNRRTNDNSSSKNEVKQKLRTVNSAFSNRALKAIHQHDIVVASSSRKAKVNSSSARGKKPLSSPTRKSVKAAAALAAQQQQSGSRNSTKKKPSSTKKRQSTPVSTRPPSSSKGKPVRVDPARSRPSSPTKQLQSPQHRKPTSPSERKKASPVRSSGPRDSSSTLVQLEQHRRVEGSVNQSVSRTPGEQPRGDVPRQPARTKKSLVRHPPTSTAPRIRDSFSSTRYPRKSLQPERNSKKHIHVRHHPSGRSVDNRSRRSNRPTSPISSKSIPKSNSGQSSRMIIKTGGSVKSLSSRLQKVDGPGRTLSGIVPPNASARAKRRAALRRMLDEKEAEDAARCAIFSCFHDVVSGSVESCVRCGASSGETIMKMATYNGRNATNTKALPPCEEEKESQCGSTESNTDDDSAKGDLNGEVVMLEEEVKHHSDTEDESASSVEFAVDGPPPTGVAQQDDAREEGTIVTEKSDHSMIRPETAAILLKVAANQNRIESFDASTLEDTAKYSPPNLKETPTDTDSDADETVEEDALTVGGKNRYSRQVDVESTEEPPLSLLESTIYAMMPKDNSTTSDGTQESSSESESISLYDV